MDGPDDGNWVDEAGVICEKEACSGRNFLVAFHFYFQTDEAGAEIGSG